MNIEIMFDPIADAADSNLRIGENHEILPDSDWVLWVRRFTGVEDLFVYFHKVTFKFVLAKWMYHPERDGIGIALELEAFDYPPNWMPPSQEWVRGRIRSAQSIAESVKKGIRDQALTKKKRDRDNIEEKHRVADWMKRQGNEESAHMIRQRKWSANDDPEFGSFKQDLLDKAKGRIVTGG